MSFRRYLIFFSLFVGLTWLLSYWLSFYMALASGAYFLMLSGVVLRRERTLHMALMLTAIFTDLSLVLVLELQRSAIETALSMAMSPLQQAHIFCSSLALLLYFPVVILGVKSFFASVSRGKYRAWHMRLGLLALTFRSLGFLFMFSLL